MFDKAPAGRFLGDFINFSDSFFFSSLFSRLLRYKLNSVLVVMALYCLIMTALEETEYIALRDFAKSLRELKNIYFCRLRPADAIVSGLLSYDDISLTEGCREKHLELIILDKIRRA